MNPRALCIGVICVVAFSKFAFIADSVEEDPPNTGMADPVALENAFDRFLRPVARRNFVVLSLSNLRGVSSEAVNAGGRVTVDLATGVVGSTVQLLPPGWHVRPLVDRQPAGCRPHHARRARGCLDEGRHLRRGHRGAQALGVTLGPTAFTSFFPDRAFVVRSGESPMDGFVLTGPSTFFDASAASSDPLRR